MDKILTFTGRQAFREWLDRYGEESDGVWLLFGKKEKIVTALLVPGTKVKDRIPNE